MNETTIMSRPLTRHMLEMLMDCHERELMNLEPHNPGTLRFANGLIQRGMLGTKAYITAKGKQIIIFYVTNAGRRYLSNL